MIEKSKVLEAAKLLNDSKLAEKKVKTVATSVETLKEDFMAAVETISEKDEKKIPKAVAKMYNDLVEETESAVDDNTDVADEEVAEEEVLEKKVEKKGKVKKAKPEPEVNEDDNDDKEEVLEKKVEKKLEKKGVKKGSKGAGIGEFIITGLKKNTFKGKTNIEIAEIVREKFNSNTKASNISWYKYKIQKEK